MIKSILIMGFVVKNTTICGVLDLLCPHSCRGCGQLGEVLCGCCKKYILERYVPICPVCKKVVAKKSKSGKNFCDASKAKEKVNNYSENGTKLTNKTGAEKWNGKCNDCETSLNGIFCFGWREGVLEKLVEEYKYQSIRAMRKSLVEFYDYIVPDLGGKVVIVPLPTIGRHVRERGFDHTLALAKGLAQKRGWKCKKILARRTDTVQVGAKVTERKEQAKKAYMVDGEVDVEKTYLLLDDVWTTGSSVFAAEKALRDAGARKVYAAVLVVSKPKKNDG